MSYARTAYFSSHSVPKLVEKAAGVYIPLPWHLAFDRKIWSKHPWKTPTGADTTPWYYTQNLHHVESCIGHLIPFQGCTQEVREVVLDIDGPSILGAESQFDRWLLVLFGHSRSELNHMLPPASAHLTLSSVCSEIQEAASPDKGVILRYLAHHGDPDLIDVLMAHRVDIAGMLPALALSGHRNMFDLVLDSYPIQKFDWSVIAHTEFFRERMIWDSAFWEHFLDRLATSYGSTMPSGLSPSGTRSPFSLLKAFLESSIAWDGFFWIEESIRLPIYFDTFLDGCINKLEETHCSFDGDIHALIHCATRRLLPVYQSFPGRQAIQNPCHLYRILRKLVHSPAFRIGINHSDHHDLGDDDAGKVFSAPMAWYSPLMLALNSGMKPAVEILVEAGADITARTTSGRSPLDIARRNVEGEHPRVWWTCRSGEKFRPVRECDSEGRQDRRVPASTDEEMLQILLDAIKKKGGPVMDAESHAPKKQWRKDI